MGKIERLFSEFSPVTTSEWEQKIQQDLKGQPCDKLIWNTPEGFAVKAYYRNEDLEGLEYLKNIPGPFSTGNAVGQNTWEIRQDILVDDWNEANAAALEALKKGVTSLGFIIPGTKLTDRESMRSLLNGIFIDCINLNFDAALQTEKVIKLLAEVAEEKRNRSIKNKWIGGRRPFKDILPPMVITPEEQTKLLRFLPHSSGKRPRKCRDSESPE